MSNKGPALFTSYDLRILCSNALNIGAMSGFTVTGITCDHAIFIYEVQALCSAASFMS